MKIRNSAAEIGQYGYEHWSGRLTDAAHSLLLVPQSIADGWDGYCSCGAWRAFASFYEIAERDALLAAIKAEHEKHVQSVR